MVCRFLSAAEPPIHVMVCSLRAAQQFDCPTCPHAPGNVWPPYADSNTTVVKAAVTVARPVLGGRRRRRRAAEVTKTTPVVESAPMVTSAAKRLPVNTEVKASSVEASQTSHGPVASPTAVSTTKKSTAKVVCSALF